MMVSGENSRGMWRCVTTSSPSSFVNSHVPAMTINTEMKLRQSKCLTWVGVLDSVPDMIDESCWWADGDGANANEGNQQAVSAYSCQSMSMCYNCMVYKEVMLTATVTNHNNCLSPGHPTSTRFCCPPFGERPSHLRWEIYWRAFPIDCANMEALWLYWCWEMHRRRTFQIKWHTGRSCRQFAKCCPCAVDRAMICTAVTSSVNFLVCMMLY